MYSFTPSRRAETVALENCGKCTVATKPARAELAGLGLMDRQSRGTEEIGIRQEPIPKSAQLEHEWRQLEHGPEAASFFRSWHWIRTLLAEIPEESRPSLLRVCSNDRTVALALLGVRLERRRGGLVRSRALFLNETGDPTHNLGIEYNDFVAAPGYSEIARCALVDWFAKCRADFDELSINGANKCSLQAVLRHRKLSLREIAYPAYRVDLSRLDKGGKISSIMSSNGRQQLNRAFRHYQSFGELVLHQANSIHEAKVFFGEMKRLHIASWERRGQTHSFSNPFFERFHRSLIEHSFSAGVIQLICATAGNHVIGYLYNFRYGTRVYAYQSGFAYGGRRARPGVVTHALAIEEAYRSGARVYDFLAGRNRLKEDFATSVKPMVWATIQQPRCRFKLEALARLVKERVTAYSSWSISTKSVALGADLVLRPLTEAPGVS